MNEIATALHSLLAHNIVSFTFRKVDGIIRKAIGTRNLALAEIHTCTTIPTPKGEEQPNSYYDVEKMGWRSYKPENLISIDGVYAREDTDFAKKSTTPNVETKKPELPKREIPIVEMPKHYDDDPIDLGFIVKPTDGGDLRKPDINAIIGGLFGGGGVSFGGDTLDTNFIPISTPKENMCPKHKWDKEDEQNLNVCLSYIKDETLRQWLKDAIHNRYNNPIERFNDGKIHTPVATERGFEIPVGGVPVEEFAKMVAHYVVDELVTRLTR